METLEFERERPLVAPGDVFIFRDTFVFMGAGRLEAVPVGIRLDGPANTLSDVERPVVDPPAPDGGDREQDRQAREDDHQEVTARVAGSRQTPCSPCGTRCSDGPGMGRRLLRG